MLIILACLAMPAVLSFYNFLGIFREYRNRTLKYIMWILTPVLGTLETVIFMSFMDVQLDQAWSEQLVNSQLHQPVWTGGWLTLGLICLIGILGAAILTACDVNKTPPLVSVLCMAAMYLLLAVLVPAGGESCGEHGPLPGPSHESFLYRHHHHPAEDKGME